MLGLLVPVAAGVGRLHERVGGRAGNGSLLLGEGPPHVIFWGARGDVDPGSLQAHSDILHWRLHDADRNVGRLHVLVLKKSIMSGSPLVAGNPTSVRRSETDEYVYYTESESIQWGELYRGVAGRVVIH